MERNSRKGAAGYLEVFLLIGLAVGGTGIVFTAATGYASTLQGPSVTVAEAVVVQGSYFAFERLTVVNTGQSTLSSFTVVTPALPSSASYCYTLTNPATLVVITSTCPTMGTNPHVFYAGVTLPPGGSVTVSLEVAGTPFLIGERTQISVITSGGASATVGAQVLPA